MAETALTALDTADVQQLPKVLEGALEQACELLEADRGVLFRCGPSQSYADAVHEWKAPDVYPVKGGRYLESEAPHCFAQLRANRVVLFSEADTEPSCPALHRLLVDQGSRAALLSPMLEAGDLQWLLVFEWKRHIPALDAGAPAFARKLGRVCQAVLKREAELRDVEETYAKLAERHKLESLGVMAGGVAHDFNNVLQSVLSLSEVLLADLAPGQARGWVENINAVAKRATALTTKLLVFSRQDARERRVVDLSQLLEETVTLLRRSIPEDRTLSLEMDEGLGTARISPTDLEQVIINLCNNASAALHGGGEIRVRAVQASDDYVEVTVLDTGTGMSSDTLRRACAPFFTTKPPGEGTGLGLAIVKRLVESAGGQLRIDSTPGTGTSVSFCIPRSDEPAETVFMDANVDIRGDETILLVEDDSMVRRVAATHLERAGFKVLRAANGEEALGIYERQREEIALVFSDSIMPRMGGAALYDAIEALGPPPPFLFGSGYDAGTLSRDFLEGPDVDFLQKPYEARQLLRCTRRLIDRHRSRVGLTGTQQAR